MTLPRRLPVLAAAGLFLALLLGTGLGFAAPARAHDQLLGSTPAEGAVLAELPESIVLEFSNELLDAGPALLIRDAADATVFTAAPAIAGRTATAPFPRLPDGAYRLNWSVVSSDGHRIEGTIPFQVALAGRVASAPAPAPATATAAPATVAPATATPTAPASPAETSRLRALALVGGAGAAAAALVAGALWWRRTRNLPGARS